MEDLGSLLATLILGSNSNNDNGDGDNHDTIGPEKNTSRSDLILLDGDLGAGKTALSRGFIRSALGDFDMPVTSPTYLLCNSYKVPGNDHDDSSEIEIQHIDLYRLPGKNPAEFDPLNLPHVFGNCVALMEWPQRLGNAAVDLPNERLEVFITIVKNSPSHFFHASNNDNNSRGSTVAEEYEKDQLRRVELRPRGKRWSERLDFVINQGYLDDLLE